MTAKPNPEQMAALRTYAAANGRFWKRKLALDWEMGTERDPLLRQVRNQFGPAVLRKFSFTEGEDPTPPTR